VTLKKKKIDCSPNASGTHPVPSLVMGLCVNAKFFGGIQLSAYLPSKDPIVSNHQRTNDGGGGASVDGTSTHQGISGPMNSGKSTGKSIFRIKEDGSSFSPEMNKLGVIESTTT